MLSGELIVLVPTRQLTGISGNASLLDTSTKRRESRVLAST